MFTAATRYSLKNDEAEKKGDEIYADATRMWRDAGAISMQRFRIIEGQHSGQQMVVVRFHTQADYEKAVAHAGDRRDQMRKDLEAAGVHMEERLLLDEVG